MPTVLFGKQEIHHPFKRELFTKDIEINHNRIPQRIFRDCIEFKTCYNKRGKSARQEAVASHNEQAPRAWRHGRLESS